MSVKLARLKSTAEDVRPIPRRSQHVHLNARAAAPRPSRRKEARYSTWFDAKLESSRGDNADVLLSEVSMHGCRIKCEETWLRTGSFVAIGLEEGPMLQAIVRWIRDGNVGMEFLRPIPPERAEWHDLMELPF